LPDANGKLTSGQLLEEGQMVYEGPLVDGHPDGKGVCVVDGSPEACEHAMGGQRIDALYKTRIENDRLRSEFQAQREADKARQAAQLAQTRAAQLQVQQAGGKKRSDAALRLGILGAIVGIAGTANGVSDEDKAKVIAAAASDLASDGETHQLYNLQQQGVQQKGSSTSASSSAQVFYDSYPFTCPASGAHTVSIPYKTKGCLTAKRQFTQVFVCNQSKQMESAMKACTAACGRSDCEEK